MDEAEKERLAQALRDGDDETFVAAIRAANPVILCAAPDCPNPAGPEGYCLTDHEDMAKAAREVVAEGLTMQSEIAAMEALRKMARKVVNTERRERWHRQNDAKHKRKRMAAASRRKQR